MTLTLFAKCEKCAKLEKVDAEYIHNEIEFTTPSEIPELTYTCENCKAKLESEQSNGFRKFSSFKEIWS